MRDLSVLVTGVSTGIGHATAKILVEHNFQVFGSVRKPADAERLKAEMGEGFVPLLFDVSDAAAVKKAGTEVQARLQGKALFGLVNNAGIALGGPLLHQLPDEFRLQIEVNLVGAFIVTQTFAPLLRKSSNSQDRPGRIVNISSVAGKFGAPFLGAYAASKHALEGFSESLRRELLLYGIDVIIVAPGAVATPIWDKAEKADVSRYANTDFGKPVEKFNAIFIQQGRTEGIAPERVGNIVLKALTAKHPKVRYAVVSHPLTNWILPNLLPARMVDRVLGKVAGLISK